MLPSHIKARQRNITNNLLIDTVKLLGVQHCIAGNQSRDLLLSGVMFPYFLNDV